MKFPLLPVLITVLMAMVLAKPANANVADRVQSLNFDVFLDERPIGYQRFELTQESGGIRMQTQAEFDVKFLLITAYEYDHRNTEVWRDGCLLAIESRTDSNGKQYAVSGRVKGNAFHVETNESEQKFEDCVSSFAYWDKNILLQRRKLLNSQTGEYMPVRIEVLGRDRIRLGDRDVSVERYVLKGKGLDIRLAYTVEGGAWVALDNRLEGGRTLSYRRSPAELAGQPSARVTRVGGQETGR